jgi:diguanylate cyclase (GGDEF)-like protein
LHAREDEVTAERATILVADDEPHIRRILQYLLEQEGYDVVVAADGEDALREVDRCAPDLVLLDVMMPRLDGFSVLRSIRSSLETARLPVILLTAKGQSSEKVTGLRGGANDYVIKPFDQEELLLRIHNMLEHARAQREANPLTGLPGNLAIAREASQRIAAGEPFAIMYIDIDRFKSFNDTYGYARGDRAITFLARVLCDAVRGLGVSSAFVGHVGGDDFIVMAPTARAEELACRIVRDFDAGVPALHDTEDAGRGYLEIRSRNGVAERVPLITLTVALIVDAHGRFAHPAALSDTLAELKRFGKTMAGSVVVKERRGTAETHELVTAAPAPDEEQVHDPGA